MFITRSFQGSINLLFVPLGCFLSGFLTEPTGKRRAMQVFFWAYFCFLLFFFLLFTILDYIVEIACIIVSLCADDRRLAAFVFWHTCQVPVRWPVFSWFEWRFNGGTCKCIIVYSTVSVSVSNAYKYFWSLLFKISQLNIPIFVVYHFFLKKIIGFDVRSRSNAATIPWNVSGNWHNVCHYRHIHSIYFGDILFLARGRVDFMLFAHFHDHRIVFHSGESVLATDQRSHRRRSTCTLLAPWLGSFCKS